MKGKSLIATIALSLVAVLGLGYLITAVALSNWNPAEWGKEQEAEEQEISNLVVTQADTAKGLSIRSKAKKAVSTSDSVGSAVELTLDVLPAGSVDTFTWSADNTSDITLSQGDKGLKCTVTCNNAFSKQITITATSDLNPDLYATCTVDYVKRITSFLMDTGALNLTLDFTSDSAGNTFTFQPSFGVGTITPEVTVSSEISNNLSGVKTSVSNTFEGTTKTRKAILQNYSFSGFTCTVKTPYDMFVSGTETSEFSESYITSAQHVIKIMSSKKIMIGTPSEIDLKSAYNNSFASAAQNSIVDGNIKITYSATYGGKTYYSDSTTYGICFNCSGIATTATSASMDDIVF